MPFPRPFLADLPPAALIAWILAAIPLQASASDPTAWQAHEGRHVRMEDGQLACYSTDRRRCSRAAPPEQETESPSSLRCDALPRLAGPPGAGYQGNGHRRIDSWCNSAYARLFARWVDHTPAGHPLMLSTTPRGDVMCRSRDGVNCLAAGATLLPGEADRPVVCGRPMLKTLGEDGYATDKASHWCQSMEVVRHISALDMVVDPAAGAKSGELMLPPWQGGETPAWIVTFRTRRSQEGSNPIPARIRLEVVNDNGGRAALSYSTRDEWATIESKAMHMGFGDFPAGDGATFAMAIAISAASVEERQPAYFFVAGRPDAAPSAIDALQPAGRLLLRTHGRLGETAAALVEKPSGPKPLMRLDIEGLGPNGGADIEVLSVTVLRRRPPPPPR
jgi:hypothetical protein